VSFGAFVKFLTTSANPLNFETHKCLIRIFTPSFLAAVFASGSLSVDPMKSSTIVHFFRAASKTTILFCLSISSFHAFAGPSKSPTAYTIVNGEQRFAPVGGFTSADAFQALASAASGGVNLPYKFAPALSDSRAVALTITEFASNASIAASIGRLASGPLGIGAALAIPYVVDWINSDNAQNIRVNPTSTGVELKNDTSTYTAQCGGGAWISAGPGTITAVATACALNYTTLYRSTGFPNCSYSAGPSSGSTWVALVGGSGCPNANFSGTGSKVTTSQSWLPASMNDIAPYMTPRVPNPLIVDALLSKGQSIDSTPVSITGPSPALTDPTPYKQITQYPKPADQTSTTTTSGNPYGIPANTPTTTGTGNGTTSVSPGSTTSTGTPPVGSSVPTPAPISVPTTRTDVSTYNPTTNQTTTTSTTKQDPYTQTTTTTSTTNITNTTNTSTAITNQTTTTSLTNNTTNVTNTTTNTTPAKNADPTPDPCDTHPDRVGCLKEGDIPASEKLSKTSQAVTVTATAFTSSSACPSPLTFNVRNLSYAVSYQPMCDRLATLKALFVAMAGFLAAYILADSFKV
jgi:hypothetical protein